MSIGLRRWSHSLLNNTHLWLWVPAFAGTTDSSIPIAAKGRAKRVAGIDADQAEFARKEFQFLQREGEALVVGMAVDVGIKLRGKKFAVDHVALELGHV